MLGVGGMVLGVGGVVFGVGGVVLGVDGVVFGVGGGCILSIISMYACYVSVLSVTVVGNVSTNSTSYRCERCSQILVTVKRKDMWLGSMSMLADQVLQSPCSLLRTRIPVWVIWNLPTSSPLPIRLQLEWYVYVANAIGSRMCVCVCVFVCVWGGGTESGCFVLSWLVYFCGRVPTPNGSIACALGISRTQKVPLYEK